MKKIEIISVYGSYNHGSFLQAKNLSDIVSKLGDVVFLNAHTREWKMIYTALKRARFFSKNENNVYKLFKIVVFEIIEAYRLKRAWGSLKQTESVIGQDVVILGSDEIWNISRPECQHNIFWGKDVQSRIISYAPSINNATEYDFKKYDQYVKYINDIKCISVRDAYSKSILEKFVSKKICIVLDPTLLKKPKLESLKKQKKYIAVYSFDAHITKEQQLQIKKFARINDLELVGTGQYIPWCDRCVHSIAGNPFYIYSNATYVITSTFHGTAYAINYGTNFVSYVEGNNKVEALLAEFGLEDRVIHQNSNLTDIFSQKIDYIKVNKLLAKKRDFAIDYLNKSIQD